MTILSSSKHIIRLIVVIVLLGIVAFIIKQWATPSDWNYVVWYRQGALHDLTKQQPLFGGNQTCVECHDEVVTEAVASSHKNLLCETCHDPVALHAKDGEKIAAALLLNEVDMRETCLRCHVKMLGKPEAYPQFIAEPSERKIRRHKKVKEDTSCLECHNPHDPVY